jgi:ABC-2 type transport system permease protein
VALVEALDHLGLEEHDLGLFLLGYGLAALGLFASSLTENQIVAFILALALEMMFFLVSQASVSLEVIRVGNVLMDVGGLLRSLSIADHFEALLAGIFRLHDLVYFAALILFWLWATDRSVESARWS